MSVLLLKRKTEIVEFANSVDPGEVAPNKRPFCLLPRFVNRVERQWLEHLWKHENMFETWVVRANEC